MQLRAIEATTTWQWRTSPLGKQISRSLPLVLISLLVGRATLGGELSPFTLALFVAVRLSSPGKEWLVLVAGALGMSLGSSPLQVASFIFAVAAYLVLERALPGRTRGSRALTASIAVLLVKIPIFLWQMPTLFETAMTIIEVGLITVLALLFSQCVPHMVEWQLERRWKAEEMLAAAVTGAVVLLGMSGLQVLGVSVQLVTLNYLIMLAAYVGGATWGASMGVAAPVALFLHHPLGLAQAGIYAFSGLVAGALKEWRKAGVIVGYCVANLLLMVSFESRERLVFSLFGCAISSVFLLLTSSGSKSKLYRLLPMAPREEVQVSSSYPTRLQGIAADRLRELCKVFLELSYTFMESYDKEEPEPTANKLLDRLAKSVCGDCSSNNNCWGKDFYKTYQSMLDMLTLTDLHGSISVDMISPLMQRKCSKAAEMVNSLNSLSELYRQSLYWEKRHKQTRELVALQLQGVSNIMSALAAELNLELEYLRDGEERITEELRRAGIYTPEVEVVKNKNGRIEITVVKRACKQGENHCVTSILPIVTGVVGRQLSKTGHRCASLSNKSKCTVCLSTAHVLATEVGYAQRAKSQGVCGDSYRTAEIAGGKLAVMISDGMGDGPRANRESQAAINLLEQLLKAGFDKETTIHTVNSVLSLRAEGESFATLDMVLMDLYTGAAEIIKIGATSSFVRRKDKVDIIKATSLPAGILSNIEVESRRMSLMAGDIVVMVSDGVLNGQKGVTDKEEWLCKILRQATGEKAQDLADYILNRAISNCSGQQLDDMTVVVLKVLDRAVSIPLVG